jgi:hypothetical protein
VAAIAREAVAAAAIKANLTVGAWVEQALGQALTEGSPQGVSLEAIEARLCRVVADELAPVQPALARIEGATPPHTARRWPWRGVATGDWPDSRPARPTLRPWAWAKSPGCADPP